MALRVIGAGFGRTGTMSLKAALEGLGFGPCYHMYELLLEHPEHAGQWKAAVRGEPIDWHPLLDGYGAAVDWPACSFYADLMEAYPDAKVLLSVRDPEKWYDSVRTTIFTNAGAGSDSSLQNLPIRLVTRKMRPVLRLIDELIWGQTFAGLFEDRQHAIDVFERHNEEVRRHVPAERLLVYQVSEGWEPLCEFLGVDVPQGRPFPHLNDAQEFRTRMRQRKAMGYAITAGAATVAGLVLPALVMAARRVVGRVR